MRTRPCTVARPYGAVVDSLDEAKAAFAEAELHPA